MPRLIQHIDAIARAKGRDALWIRFPEWRRLPEAKREKDPTRNAILAHLDQEKIQWEPCAGIASDNGYESYAGDVYVDVPFDPTNPTYARLASFLEHPDGSPKHPGVNFCYVPLASAMKNAHHDEPGYIPEWIKEFNEPWKPVAQPPHSD